MKVFLKQMGQGIDREALHSILMDEDQVAGRKKQRIGEYETTATTTASITNNNNVTDLKDNLNGSDNTTDVNADKKNENNNDNNNGANHTNEEQV